MGALPKAGIADNGIKYKVHYDRDWQEWQVRAYRQNSNGVWKFAEGPTYYAGMGGKEGREDAIQTFNHLVGSRKNPSKAKRRTSKRKVRCAHVAKRLIREVISDEGRSRYSRRHRVLRSRMMRRGADFDQIMRFNDRHRKNPRTTIKVFRAVIGGKQYLVSVKARK